MIIPCFRCRKEIDTPNDSNADYIIASDTIVNEKCEVLLIVTHNEKTLDKQIKMQELDEDGASKYPKLKVDDAEYTRTKIDGMAEARGVPENLLIRVEVKEEIIPVQKADIICPACFRETDFVIWGVHKAKVAELEKKVE